MKLLGNRILISPLPVQERTETGLFLPEGSAGDKKLWWRVDQIGTHQPKPGKFRPHGTSCSDYEIGQRVLLPGEYTHTTLPDGRKIVECGRDDHDQVIAVLE